MKPTNPIIIEAKVYPVEGGGYIVTNLALLPTCYLKKLKSEDGHWQYEEKTAFIGKAYKYAPRSRRTEVIHNTKAGKDFKCEIVMVYSPDLEYFAMMPVECLTFPDEHPSRN